MKVAVRLVLESIAGVCDVLARALPGSLPKFVLVVLSRSVPGGAVYYDLSHVGS